MVVDQLLQAGPQALGAAKRLIYEVPRRSRDEAYAWAKEMSEYLFASAEAAHGMAAFRERRPPPWAPSASERPQTG